MIHDRLIIIGAGGHGRVAADIARLNGYRQIIFLDDADNCSVITEGKVCDWIKYAEASDFFVAIGDSLIRKRIQTEIYLSGADIATLIHPNAVISDNVKIASGTVVMAGVVINTGAVIGVGAIINTSSSIDHDCEVGDFCHISVGAHLCGTVCVGEHTWIGAGATVINNINICSNCMIGAGAAVIRDIDMSGTYFGVPAKRHDTKE